MKKYIRNITSVFTAFIMLAGGNFVFALAHGDCFISSDVHITCEMECCKENPCLEDETKGIVEITDETNSCCKTHIEDAFNGDVPLPVVASNSDNLKSLISVTESGHVFSDVNDFSTIIHKHKTTNILLITSVLRI